MHVIVWFPRLNYAQLERLIQLGAARGLGLHAVHPHYRIPPPRPGLLVGFAGLSCFEVATATEILGLCVSELVHGA